MTVYHRILLIIVGPLLTELPNGEFSGIRENVLGTTRGYLDGKAFQREYAGLILRVSG